MSKETAKEIELLIWGDETTYKDRFIIEYTILSKRIEKLENLLNINNDYEGLDFEPDSPRELLVTQLQTMKVYKAILEKRAAYENIKL